MKDQERNAMQGRIEFLEEQRMILTIALGKIKPLAEFTAYGNGARIVSICEVALVEAGDEDYYDE